MSRKDFGKACVATLTLGSFSAGFGYGTALAIDPVTETSHEALKARTRHYIENEPEYLFQTFELNEQDAYAIWQEAINGKNALIEPAMFPDFETFYPLIRDFSHVASHFYVPWLKENNFDQNNEPNFQTFFKKFLAEYNQEAELQGISQTLAMLYMVSNGRRDTRNNLEMGFDLLEMTVQHAAGTMHRNIPDIFNFLQGLAIPVYTKTGRIYDALKLETPISLGVADRRINVILNALSSLPKPLLKELMMEKKYSEVLTSMVKIAQITKMTYQQRLMLKSSMEKFCSQHPEALQNLKGADAQSTQWQEIITTDPRSMLQITPISVEWERNPDLEKETLKQNVINYLKNLPDDKLFIKLWNNGNFFEYLKEFCGSNNDAMQCINEIENNILEINKILGEKAVPVLAQATLAYVPVEFDLKLGIRSVIAMIKMTTKSINEICGINFSKTPETRSEMAMQYLFAHAQRERLVVGYAQEHENPFMDLRIDIPYSYASVAQCINNIRQLALELNIDIISNNRKEFWDGRENILQLAKQRAKAEDKFGLWNLTVSLLEKRLDYTWNIATEFLGIH